MIERRVHGEEGTIGKMREGGGARRKRLRDKKEGAHSLGSAQNIHVPVLLVISKLLVAQHTRAPPVEVVGVGT